MADEPVQVDLSPVPPPMQLEQHPDPKYGNWEYWRDPWLYGPEIIRNGVLPLTITERIDAERYVNSLYPNSFPDADVPPPPGEPPPDEITPSKKAF